MKNLYDYLNDCIIEGFYSNVNRLDFDWDKPGVKIDYFYGKFKGTYDIRRSGADWWVDAFADVICDMNLPVNVGVMTVIQKNGEASMPSSAIDMIKDTPLLKIDDDRKLIFLQGPCKITPGLFVKIFKNDPRLCTMFPIPLEYFYLSMPVIACGFALGWMKQFGVVDKSKNLKDIITDSDSDIIAIMWNIINMILWRWRHYDLTKIAVKAYDKMK